VYPRQVSGDPIQSVLISACHEDSAAYLEKAFSESSSDSFASAGNQYVAVGTTIAYRPRPVEILPVFVMRLFLSERQIRSWLAWI